MVPRSSSHRSRIKTGKPVSPGLVSAMRKCLGCGGMFMSAWVGNRRCKGCKKITQNGNPVGLGGLRRSRG